MTPSSATATTPHAALQDQLQQWRDAFDRSFDEPRGLDVWGDAWRVLGIRIAGEPFALLLDELSGLLPAQTAAPYPADLPALKGLVGHRGQVMPLYDLRALLGKGNSSGTRWWAFLRCAPLALGLEDFDGQWRVGPSDRLQHREAQDETGHWTLRCNGELRPLIALEPLIERLTASLAARRDAEPVASPLA
ncbi:chemotaxis protein CheW [Roseateles sp. SL47]|uniref:chemotaxis protein CheW n=1 Tax=Roseateles sp. SL47 TaxID=2995138 RepID=UPI002271D359|nr:chemotaxis protein CheW [Roseateles sp. SL47]WAC73024.1 chemotaxis protein CheW [Roseateles sp. SL47]